MATSNRLIFFGNEKLASGITTSAPLLSSLIEAGYTITALVINQKESREEPTVVTVATEHDIPVMDLAEMEARFTQLDTKCAVLAAFGKIIPQRVIDLFPLGIVNVHPSLLPKYRGSTPIESAILNGDTETGVSLMQIVAKMDAGPLYAQQTLALNGDETKQELYEQLAVLAASKLTEILPNVLSEKALPQAQNEDSEHLSYSKTLSKNDGLIDWSKSATQLAREVRAYLGWPGSRTTLFDREITITEAQELAENGASGQVKPEKELVVYCGEGALQITKLKPAGKREMTAAEFLAGVR